MTNLVVLTHWGPWNIHMSVNWVIIGSDNGLLPVRVKVITWTNIKLFSVNWNLSKKLKWNFNQNTWTFTQ